LLGLDYAGPTNKCRQISTSSWLLASQTLKKLILGLNRASNMTFQSSVVVGDISRLLQQHGSLRELDVSGTFRGTTTYISLFKTIAPSITTLTFSFREPKAIIIAALPISVRVINITVNPSVHDSHNDLCDSLEELARNKRGVDRVYVVFSTGIFSWVTPSDRNNAAEAMLVRRLVGCSAALSKYGIYVLDQVGRRLNLV
jgi:hypothetical protein